VKRLGICVATLLLAAAPLLHAKRLPIRTYTTADGLARDHILCIVQDSHGFLWFCTAEGLSRFDGYTFTNYHTEQGLPGNAVTDFLETRAGDYWIATTDGLARFDPKGAGAARFHVYPLMANTKLSPAVVREDGEGGIWTGVNTGEGVFYLGPHDTAFRHVDVPMADPTIDAMAIDRRGAVWIGTVGGLYRRDRDGTIKEYTTADGLPNTSIMALREDREGGMWVATRLGLAHLDAAGKVAHVYSTKDGVPGTRLESLLLASDGTLWVGGVGGLAEWTPQHPVDGREFQAYTQEQGLTAKTVGALAEDRDGNLWIGTFGSGAMKIARNGFITFTEADGAPWAASLLESRRGEMCVEYRAADGPRIGRFDGQKFVPVRPAWPSTMTYSGWGRGEAVAQDPAGEWWFATAQGLFRFARQDSVEGLAGARPKAVYTKRDGLAGNEIYSVFADSQNRIWIGTIGLGNEDGLAMWDPKTERVRAFAPVDGLPKKALPNVLAEDRSGNIWAALYHGGVVRYRQGRFTFFDEKDGITGTAVWFFVDSRGRLWICTSRGLIHVEDPDAERPRMVVYGPAQGLSSNDIDGLTEDHFGRLYAATGRGIDRFEPQGQGLGRIQHYTTADGVARGALDLTYADREGRLWFSTTLGLSELLPVEDRPRQPPPVLVTGVSVGGVARPISDLGQTAVSGLRLPQSPLRLDFVGLGFLPGESLRYQYMLENADPGWSAPTDQRSVIYGRLSAGSYRFLVRAVTGDGVASAQPASVAFTVLPPVWRTWWFLLACGTAAAMVMYGLYRYRLAQLLAVANVRTRIATDLHDDIGASLSQIAILSEVAQRGNGHGAQNAAPLSEIAGISRELVDSMSDIVWAINPDHDRLSNLIYRMRRFAADLLGAQGIALQFHSTVADHDLRIGANVRRQIYLIFKEAVHNIARHSGASEADVELDRDGDNLVLRLRDNGKGFDVKVEGDGHGLPSIRKRAAALGAWIEWQSAPGQGTTLRMTVRLEPARSLSLLRGYGARFFR
jgi:ligand-binding sensor domain-containing protein/two-component sensor histidine kinase